MTTLAENQKMNEKISKKDWRGKQQLNEKKGKKKESSLVINLVRE